MYWFVTSILTLRLSSLQLTASCSFTVQSPQRMFKLKRSTFPDSIVGILRSASVLTPQVLRETLVVKDNAGWIRRPRHRKDLFLQSFPRHQILPGFLWWIRCLPAQVLQGCHQWDTWSSAENSCSCAWTTLSIEIISVKVIWLSASSLQDLSSFSRSLYVSQVSACQSIREVTRYCIQRVIQFWIRPYNPPWTHQQILVLSFDLGNSRDCLNVVRIYAFTIYLGREGWIFLAW